MTPSTVALVALLAGCGDSSTTSPATTTTSAKADDPAAMAAIARKLQASPDRRDQILAEAGLDAAAWDAAMYRIAADPQDSAAFEAASR